MKERLIELLMQGETEADKQGNFICYVSRDKAECIADFLLANGVIVPPCKVGDTVWLVFTPKYPANPSDKGKWFMVQDGVQRLLYGAKGISIETWNMGTYAENKIGKTVFLTREEAEKALAERQGK